jgi:hypothetical protein
VIWGVAHMPWVNMTVEQKLDFLKDEVNRLSQALGGVESKLKHRMDEIGNQSTSRSLRRLV